MYVANPFEAIQYTYYTFEIRPELFKNLLFKIHSIVNKTVKGSVEKYSDDMSLLTLDTETKIMNYVDPSAESISRDNTI